MVARGVVEGAKNTGAQIPVVVRLEGTNVEEGQRVLRDSGLNFTVADGMKDAAEKAVALANPAADCRLRTSKACDATKNR
jgi:succinyl-CoA synthetase beta subunit